MALTPYQQIMRQGSLAAQNARYKAMSKIMGLNQQQYTLPHIQWNNHVTTNQIGANQPTNANVLMKVGRYLPLRITRK